MLTPKDIYEQLGRPSFERLSDMVASAERRVLEAGNILEKQASLTLVSSFYAVIEWIESNRVVKNAEGVMAGVNVQIQALKKLLLDKERIRYTDDHGIQYERIGVDGNVVGFMEFGGAGGVDDALMLAIGNNDKAAKVKFFAIAREYKRKAERKAKIEEMSRDIARIIPAGVELSIMRDDATLVADTKSIRSFYKNRLKDIQENKSVPALAQ